MRTLHLNNQEWKYQVGKEFVKAVSPVGKVHLIKREDLVTENSHECSEHLVLTGVYYPEFKCAMCEKNNLITPGKIKSHLELL